MKIILYIFLFSTFLIAKESCYTVQIVSALKSNINENIIKSKSYDDSCEIMNIGKNLTVRCGCFEEYKEAKKTLPHFTKEYKQAYVMSTYKSRFTSLNHETTKQVVVRVEKPLAEKSFTKRSVTVVEKVVLTPTKKKKKLKKEKVRTTKYVKKRETIYSYNKYLKLLSNSNGIHPYDYRYKFGAQISYDFTYVDEANMDYTNSDWRRVRVYHQGSYFHKKLFYELEYSFTGKNKYKDNFIGYKDKFRKSAISYRVKFGNIKVPFSLERYTSSKNLTFMERSLVDAYGEGRKFGVELLVSKKIYNSRINIFLSAFANSIDEKKNDEEEKYGYSLRGTYAYKFRKNHLFSVGMGYYEQDINGEKVKFTQGAEAEFVNNEYASASVKNVSKLKKINLEMLYIYDNYSFQGEYTKAALNAINKSDVGEYTDYNFDGYYLQGSYFLFGKGKRYKLSTSTLGKIKPYSGGSLELAMRYSHVNFNNKDEDNNGAQSDYSFGVNYYFTKELKFMLNYIIAQPEETKEYDGLLNVLEARVLVTF